MYELANKPNRYLANLLRNRAHTQNISGIRNSEATISYNNEEINELLKYSSSNFMQHNSTNSHILICTSSLQKWRYHKLHPSKERIYVNH